MMRGRPGAGRSESPAPGRLEDSERRSESEGRAEGAEPPPLRTRSCARARVRARRGKKSPAAPDRPKMIRPARWAHPSHALHTTHARTHTHTHAHGEPGMAVAGFAGTGGGERNAAAHSDARAAGGGPRAAARCRCLRAAAPAGTRAAAGRWALCVRVGACVHRVRLGGGAARDRVRVTSESRPSPALSCPSRIRLGGGEAREHLPARYVCAPCRPHDSEVTQT